MASIVMGIAGLVKDGYTAGDPSNVRTADISFEKLQNVLRFTDEKCVISRGDIHNPPSVILRWHHPKEKVAKEIGCELDFILALTALDFWDPTTVDIVMTLSME